MTKIYRSRLLASVHETAEGLNQAGILSNPDIQMFGILCLTSEETAPTRRGERNANEFKKVNLSPKLV